MASPSSSPLPPETAPNHPFAHTSALLEIIPDDKIDVEEESRLYDDLCDEVDDSQEPPYQPSQSRRQRPPSTYSRDAESQSIWLGDNSGKSLAFARDVQISGWTNVGDKLGGAYIVYDCVIKTKEGTSIHAHKRYSDFVELDTALRCTLPPNQRHYVPSLPPKEPLARYRPTFLDRRRLLLQYWLSSVLLHPDLGASKAVREWVMD